MEARAFAPSCSCLDLSIGSLIISPLYTRTPHSFDGHVEDHYHYLTEEDYAWITRELVAVAEGTSGKVISVLEGGYHVRPDGGPGKRLPGRPANSTRGARAASGGPGGATSDDDEAGRDGVAKDCQSHINEETDGGLAKGVMAHVMALMDDAGTFNMAM